MLVPTPPKRTPLTTPQASPSSIGRSKVLRPLALAAVLVLAGVTTAAAQDCGPVAATLSPAPTLAALTTQIADRAPAKILAIGSSSTEGVGATSRKQAYPAQLEIRLRNALPRSAVSVLNAGIGSETGEETLVRLIRLVHYPVKPDLVIWQVGTIDALNGTDVEAFKAVLQRGIDVVRRAGVDMILMDQQFIPNLRGREHYERYVRAVKEVGAANGVSIFSRYDLMRGWNDQGPDVLGAMYATDTLHMSDRGYACLASSLSDAIVGTLKVEPINQSAMSHGRPS